MKYLFVHSHSGYYSTYQPLTSKKVITQEQAEKFMKMRRQNGRIDTSIDDLIIVANDHGYEMKAYRNKYIKPEDYPNNSYAGAPDYDDLPSDFSDWECIYNISGSY